MENKTATASSHQLGAAPYILALLCFALPFLKFSCKADPEIYQRVKGYELVLGTQVHPDNEPASAGQTRDNGNIPASPLAAIVLGCVFIALLAGLNRAHLATSLLSMGGIGALVQLKSGYDAMLLKQSEGAFRVESDIGFMLVAALLIIGLLLNLFLWQSAKKPRSD